MRWLKNKLRKWLGIESNENNVKYALQLGRRANHTNENLVSIGVDVHFKGQPHMILIYSRLNGGQIREIPVKFDNLRDLNNFIKELKDKYNTDCETWDLPPQFKGFHNF